MHSYPDTGRGATRLRLADVNTKLVTWGGPDSAYLCVNGVTLNVHFVARLVSKSFPQPGFNDYKSVTCRFKFMREVDARVARRLTYEKYKEPVSKSLHIPLQGYTWFSSVIESRKTTFMGTAPCVKAKEVHPFANIYDGTETFGSKKHMDHITDDDLKVNDVCLFECRINRYNKEGTWSSAWKLNFRIDCITRLFAAPSSAPSYEESDEEGQRDLTDDEMEGF